MCCRCGLQIWILKPLILIREAVKDRAEHPIYGYTFRSDSYYQANIDWFKKQYDWEVEKDWIVFFARNCPGSEYGCFLALTNRGDKIIVQPPVYFPFFLLLFPIITAN